MTKLLPYLAIVQDKTTQLLQRLYAALKISAKEGKLAWWFERVYLSDVFALRFHPSLLYSRKRFYTLAIVVDLVLMGLILANGVKPTQRLLQPVVTNLQPLHPLTQEQTRVASVQNAKQHEVFGFAPHWTINKLDNVDFETLTTLAYFDVIVQSNGDLDRSYPGYEMFKSRQATQLFKKAHANGTRVVLTVTQMQPQPILALLDDPQAQQNAIIQIVDEVQKRGIDGINVDIEYGTDAGQDYRDKFTVFVANLTDEMHRQNPNSKVTVSVYASAIKQPKIYDIEALSKVSDGIFMMAYDFAVAGSDNAIPTSPLYGHKSGKYWYDVSTAVEDFLAQMPAEKLILGLPWYGYNYPVYQPEVKAETLPSWGWGGRAVSQTYAVVAEHVTPDRDDISDFQTGWDEDGQVGWKAYYAPNTGTWRMIFIDDAKSLAIKYDFAKQKKLGGVGIWALGFDDGKTELWSLLRDEFGAKLADHSIVRKVIASDGEG